MSAETLARALGEARREGNEWRALCPAHHDHNPSLSITEKNGKLLVTCRAGCSQENVMDALKSRDLWDSDRAHRDLHDKGGDHKKHNWTPTPVPVNERLPDGGRWPDGKSFPDHMELGTPNSVVWFHNEVGEVVVGECRFDITDSDRKPDKTYRPLTYCQRDDGARCGWRWKGFPRPYPLFDLPSLGSDPTKPVIITEGARKSQSARELFPGFAATAALFGAKSPEHSDWSALSRRDVIVWPDNDSTGVDFAAKVAELATKAGAKSVSIVEIPSDWPKKWDLRDPLPEGVTDETLTEMLQSARPWTDLVSQPPERPEDTEESIREAISILAPGDIPGAQSVIERIAAARIPPLIADDLIKAIKTKTGLKAKALDQTLSQAKHACRTSGGGGDDDESQATALAILANAKADFFRNAAGDGFATIEMNDHKETWSIRSKAFRGWLIKLFYDDTGSAPNSESVGAALNVLEAMARFDGAEIPVWLRVGEHEGKVYLDMCDAAWRAIELDADGWRIVSNPPVKFRRTNGMLPLPVPQQGGDIQSLRELLNVKDNDSFTLAVGFLLGALNPHGPYAVLGLGGDHGAAKTTCARTIRDLVDPHSLPPRSLPREDRDLFIAANNGWLPAFDNVSNLPDWLSDSLCRLSTGGGFATRQLYSDGEEVLFEAMRPVILNGIDAFITRADLADRSLLLNLKRIDNPVTETKLRAKFQEAHPGILGALLDAVSHGIKHMHETSLDKLPRMADFAQWVTACEGALWETGTFVKAYEANRAEATETVLEADPVAVAVRKLMAGRTEPWKGTATTLLDRLSSLTSDAEKRDRKWPKAGHALSGRLRRLVVGLREVRVDVHFSESGHAKLKEIMIANIASAGALESGAPANHTEAPARAPAKMPWEPYVAGAAGTAGAIFPTKGMQERARQVAEEWQADGDTASEKPSGARAPACQRVREKAPAAPAPIELNDAMTWDEMVQWVESWSPEERAAYEREASFDGYPAWLPSRKPSPHVLH